MKRSSALLVLSVCLIGALYARKPESTFSDKLPVPGYSVAVSKDIAYGTSWEWGFLVSLDGGKSWEKRNAGLPQKVVYPFTGGEIHHITSFGFDPSNPVRVAVTTSYGLYISDNGGLTFREIPLRHPIKRSNYLTSVALVPGVSEVIYLGTSFNGVFVTMNCGETWNSISTPRDLLYRGAGFFEEVAGLALNPGDPEKLYMAAGFGRGLYVHQSETGWEEIPGPAADTPAVIRHLLFTPGRNGWELTAVAEAEKWVISVEGWKRKPDNPHNSYDSYDFCVDGEKRRALAADRHGIYIRSDKAAGEFLEEHLSFIREKGLNSFVVDVKDDFGRITYDTNLSLPEEIGAVYPRFAIRDLIRRAHEEGLYIIGRIVVFKDEKLYRAFNNRYALWDPSTDSPWGHKIPLEDEEGNITSREQREFWVDPFSRDVWEYNVAIARELQDLGIDEIQFDYIRFPSDGDVSSISFRHQRENMGRIEALESFLRRAREEITIPISTDLYGFNSWYRMGNWIGQNIEMLSHYVDVICPMYYPSHFPRDFISDLPYLERAKLIYQEGSERSAMIAGGRSLIRPYVQAFLIGGELSMEQQEYSRYLLEQLQGTRAGNASGFTLWNMSNKYYMVTMPLHDYAQSN